MPFYKCYGCMKTFYSDSRCTACKYCHKILTETVNRAPNPPRLERRHSSPDLGIVNSEGVREHEFLTPEQRVRRREVEQFRRRSSPQCPRTECQSINVLCLGDDDSGLSRKGKFYACQSCQVMFIWDPEIQFDPRFAYMDVGNRMQPLNCVGFRCLWLETGLSAVAKIFAKGFPVRSEENLGYRTNVHGSIVETGSEGFPKAGDILPDTGHCFAKTLVGCTTFPNEVEKTDTFIFVCFLRYGFDTHAQQRRDVATILDYYPGLQDREDAIGWPLHAFEVAVDSVEPVDILACIPCKKVWKSTKWSDGGTYVLDLGSIIFRKGLPMLVVKGILSMCEPFAKGQIPPTLV